MTGVICVVFVGFFWCLSGFFIQTGMCHHQARIGGRSPTRPVIGCSRHIMEAKMASEAEQTRAGENSSRAQPSSSSSSNQPLVAYREAE